LSESLKDTFHLLAENCQEHVEKDGELVVMSPAKEFQQQVEFAMLALSAMELTFDSVTEESMTRYQSAMKSLMNGPFKKTFLVQPMGAKISESLAEYIAFLRTKKAVCLEMVSLMLGHCTFNFKLLETLNLDLDKFTLQD